MDAYSLWMGYGFLLIIAIFFSFFIHYALSEVKEKAHVTSAKPVAERAGTITLSGGLLSLLNLIQYSVISLILLYVIIIMLLIFQNAGRVPIK